MIEILPIFNEQIEIKENQIINNQSDTIRDEVIMVVTILASL